MKLAGRYGTSGCCRLTAAPPSANLQDGTRSTRFDRSWARPERALHVTNSTVADVAPEDPTHECHPLSSMQACRSKVVGLSVSTCGVATLRSEPDPKPSSSRLIFCSRLRPRCFLLPPCFAFRCFAGICRRVFFGLGAFSLPMSLPTASDSESDANAASEPLPSPMPSSLSLPLPLLASLPLLMSPPCRQ